MDGANVMIVDFSRAGGPTWRSIDDVVMGGVSKSRLRPTGEGSAVFEGELSLQQGGGFASVRAALGPLDLSVCTGLEIRVRGDGKRYRLRLRNDDRLDGVAYQAQFLADGDNWQTVRLPFAEFVPTYRGRVLEGVEPLDTGRIHQVGLMIADRQAGPFRLELAWLRTCADDTSARKP
jgi:monofunctional biosynthetic peptidoglycan transglycosylase